VATGEENWEDALTRNIVTPMHLLHPTTLIIQLDRSLITDDPRLPKFKVTGTLPNVAVDITGIFPVKHTCVKGFFIYEYHPDL
jgi:vacuolar protein sorting-associated protein 13A/C